MSYLILSSFGKRFLICRRYDLHIYYQKTQLDKASVCFAW